MTPLNLSMRSSILRDPDVKSFEVSQYLVKNGADMTEEERLYSRAPLHGRTLSACFQYDTYM